ncbi:MAG: hypothetical protein WD696_09200 [Bryobacteraceae bacterium]
MPSLISLGLLLLAQTADPWPRVLSSVGVEHAVTVLRPGAELPPGLMDRVEAGAFVIVEGSSPAAAALGFREREERVRVASVEDLRRPKLRIVWERTLDLPRFDVPADAQIFARERWSKAPLMAGFRKGAGAILWVAASPGGRGYERFPYILHALSDLGLEAPFRSARLWAFFDYSYRPRVDLEYFAKRWREAGIGALHVAAWHFHESDPERDAYLRRLIEAAHNHGILVYAWLELPHVSEAFWNAHPEWREKTAVLQDAHLDWRKLMNLTNRDCFRVASAGVSNLLLRFDWDGVNLAELYFESLEGADNPARFTPMNNDVRALFREQAGFDPIELFGNRRDPAALRQFLDFRAGLARRMQEEWMDEIARIRKQRPNFDLALTHVDDRLDTDMRDAIGADAARVLPLLDREDFTFMIEDPATVWHLGPERYSEIARRYQPLTPHTDKLAIDINIVERYQDVYPTKQQTGSELLQLVHMAARAFHRVALYFENSILPPDWKLLPASAAVLDRVERQGAELLISSPRGIGVQWRGGVLVNGKPWPVRNDTTVWLPAGEFRLTPAPESKLPRVLDFNGDLIAAAYTENGIELEYSSSSRALAVLEGRVLLLPRGQHRTKIPF